MRVNLPRPLPDLVETQFSAASKNGSLIFSATEVCTINTTAGIPFQLRYCPALSKKPTAEPSSTSDDETPKTKFDPFESPSPDLFVAAIPEPDAPTHILVLNKYPVIRDHLIIATKENKPQTHILERDDLAATYSCLTEWERAKGPDAKLFAFFNSGEHSGASQPHRHLQFLPVDNMHSGVETQGWELLVDRVLNSSYIGSTGFVSNPGLPFSHFAFRIPPNPSAAVLHTIYTALYSTAVDYVRRYILNHPGELTLHSTEDGSSSISYNLAITTSAMVICPRRRGGDKLKLEDGTELDLVELNGTVLGGTLMVKENEQWEALRNDPGVLTRLLETIGIPWENGEGQAQL
ncbi:HIT-like domain-containing protein [Phyllosticta capitalensis]|uniref:HIT-like domain-containing protein n=1 Tax=Phyllosticta capitalensis TaxID=121624 RepID=A0ABR1YPV5_9PEZI